MGGPRAPQIFSPLPSILPGRPYQQRSPESGRAADPAGPVQRGLPLPGDPPHAVCRLPQGQEGCLPGDSRGGWARRGRGRCSHHPGPGPPLTQAAEASGQGGVGCPHLMVGETEAWEVESLAPGCRSQSRRDLRWAGLRPKPSPAPCPPQGTLPKWPSRGLEGAHRREADLGVGDTQPRFHNSQALLEARLSWFGLPPFIRGFQSGCNILALTQNIPGSQDPCLEGGALP